MYALMCCYFVKTIVMKTRVAQKRLETGEYFLGKRSLGPFTSLQQRPYLTTHF